MNELITPLSATPWQAQAVAVGLITCVSAAVWWFLIRLQSRSAGHDWKSEVWAVIKQDPLATAVYRVGVYIAIAILVSSGFSRFIG